MCVFIYLDREKIKRLRFHPYKPVSWLFTHQGFFFFFKNIHDHFMSWRMKQSVTAYNYTKHWNILPRPLCKFVKYINDGYEYS